MLLLAMNFLLIEKIWSRYDLWLQVIIKIVEFYKNILQILYLLVFMYFSKF